VTRRQLISRASLALVVLALLAGGAYWWQRAGRAPAAFATPTSGLATAVADQLRKTPLRTRWAPPICQPSGIVHLPGGAAAANATVVLEQAPLSHRLAVERVDAPDVQTDAAGRFLLPPTAAGAWLVIATLPRQRAVVRALTIAGTTDCTNLDLTLGPAGDPVTGTITDVSGGPVKGALVALRPAATPDGPPVAIGATRDDGRYELAAGAGDYAVTVRHPEYVGVDGQLAVHGPTTFDAVLTPGAAIRGIVMTRDHRTPVAGAKVTIRGGRASGAMGGLEREAVTDDSGRFVFTGLGSGRMRIVAVAPESASRDPVELALGIAETRDDIEVLVDPARRIRGIVARAGTPVPGALVSGSPAEDAAASGAAERLGLFEAGDETGEISAETDAAGVFELWGLAPGAYELTAMAPQMLPSPSVRADTTRADVDNIALELGTGVVVRGRVEPPQIATISIGGGVEHWISGADVTSGADGRFEIAGVEPGETVVTGQTESGLTGEASLVVDATGASDVIVPLSSHGVTIVGRVADSGGKPVAGVYVAGWNTVTGTDGAFRAEHVEPGEYTLTVSDDEDALQILAPKLPEGTIDVPATGIPELAITVEPRDRTLRGIVVGPDGKPAADAWVVAVTRTEDDDGDDGEPELDLSSSAFDWTGKSKIALTDGEGRFAIAGLRAAAYDVAAEGDKGGARGVARKVTPDHPVRVQLTALAGLAITALRGGAPVAHWDLELMGPEPDHRTVAAADGRLTLRGLPPGEYTIQATSAEGGGKATVTLVQGASATATVVIGAWATVSGTIVDSATGKPIANVTALIDDALLASDANDAPPWISDAAGKFRIDRVPPGRGEVVIYHGLGEGVHVPFTATDGGHVDVGVVKVQALPPDDVPDLPAPDDGDEP
jgi:hypothetical protein